MSSNEQLFVIVAAAGSSTRMGGGVPKVFRQIAGKMVLAHSLDRLWLGISQAGATCEGTVVVAPAAYRREIGTHLEGHSLAIVEGGSTRAESVRRGLREIERQRGGTINSALVLIHDAARCLVPPDAVARLVQEGIRCGAATLAVPSVDTLVASKEGEWFDSLVDRRAIWAIQTPQIFRYELLQRAHTGTSAEATDDSSLVALFHPVRLVPGSRLNLKITVPEDLAIAEALLAGGEATSCVESE